MIRSNDSSPMLSPALACKFINPFIKYIYICVKDILVPNYAMKEVVDDFVSNNEWALYY